MIATKILPGWYCVSTIYKRERIAQMVKAPSKHQAVMKLVDRLIQQEKQICQSTAKPEKS